MAVEGRTVYIPITSRDNMDPITSTTLKLLESAEDPGIGKVVIPFNYNPNTLFEALQIYDAVKGFPKETIMIVSGLATPNKTLALQGADVRLATAHTFFSVANLVEASMGRLKADEAEAISSSLVQMQKVVHSLIAERAGIPSEEAEAIFKTPRLYTFDEAKKVGKYGLVDSLLFN